MKANKLFPSLLFVAALFQGCEQIVELDTFKPAPKLVLNGVVKAGEPVCANLSRTWFHTDGKPNQTIPDADVKLYVNEQFREQMSFVAPTEEGQAGTYKAAYSPAVGDRIRITASASGYPDIAVASELPKQMVVEDCRLKVQKNFYWEDDSTRQYFVNYTLELTVQDPPEEENYYLVHGEELRYYNGYGYEYEPGRNMTADRMTSKSSRVIPPIGKRYTSIFPKIRCLRT